MYLIPRTRVLLWEADVRSDGQGIPHILRHPRLDYDDRRCLSLNPVLRKSVHIVIPYCFSDSTQYNRSIYSKALKLLSIVQGFQLQRSTSGLLSPPFYLYDPSTSPFFNWSPH